MSLLHSLALHSIRDSFIGNKLQSMCVCVWWLYQWICRLCLHAYSHRDWTIKNASNQFIYNDDFERRSPFSQQNLSSMTTVYTHCGCMYSNPSEKSLISAWCNIVEFSFAAWLIMLIRAGPKKPKNTQNDSMYLAMCKSCKLYHSVCMTTPNQGIHLEYIRVLTSPIYAENRFSSFCSVLVIFIIDTS